MLIVILFYTSYRYPFMINSTQTSPVYSDTPGYLQAGKFLIFIGIFSFFSFKHLFSAKPFVINKLIIFCFYGYLFLLPLIYSLVTRNSYLFTVGFFFIIPIMFQLFFPTSALNLSRYSRIVSACIIIFIVVNALQIFLFLSIGRLPALGWKDSFSVRFGSILDDPNSFGIMLAFFIGFATYHYRGTFRIVMLILLASCLFLTQSATAIVLVPFSILVASLLYFKRYYKVFLSVLFLLLICSALFYKYLIFFEPIIVQKQSSAADHRGSLLLAHKSEFISYLGLAPVESTVESGYINLLTTMGVAYVVFFLLIGLLAVSELISLLYGSKNNTVRSILFGSLCFLISFYFACLNFPFEKIFPINALAYLIIGLTTSGAFRRGIDKHANLAN